MTPLPVSSGGDLEAEPWLAVPCLHGEGVVWDHAAGRLLFVDIPRGRVFEAGLAAPGAAAGGEGAEVPGVRWFDLPAPVTAVHPTTDPGTVLVADGDGVALAAGGEVTERLAAPLAGLPGVRMNDGNLDPAGRYFIGSMANDAATGAGTLYRLDRDRSLHTMLTGVTISNGIDWSPDSTLCYFVDSTLRRIDVFDYDLTTGELSGRRVLADTSGIPGIPDGLTVDAEGAVWVAFYGGSRVCRFGPDGRLDRTVTLPVSQVTSCCFAGPDLDQLIISTSTQDLTPAELAAQPAAGTVFRAAPGCRGRIATEFVI